MSTFLDAATNGLPREKFPTILDLGLLESSGPGAISSEVICVISSVGKGTSRY